MQVSWIIPKHKNAISKSVFGLTSRLRGGIAGREVVWAIGLLWGKGGRLVSGDMRELMGGTQNKAAPPKYMEFRHNNLPD